MRMVGSAGIVGAGASIVLLGLGPVFGVVLGLLANYIARSSDNEVGEVARGVGKTALDVYNYLAKLNEKYKVRGLGCWGGAGGGRPA